MRAARISGPKQFEIIDIDMPDVKDGQCLVKLEGWSVCGSDIRHGYGPVYPEEQYPMRAGAPCHECIGTIVDSRSNEFSQGQRVIVLPGRDGPGGLVEYLASYPDRMVAVPDEGTVAEWVMCQPSGTVLYSCQQMGTILGKRVLVLGQGSIGLSFTAICARAGASQVIAVDLHDHRLELAKKFGATHTVNPTEETLDDAIEELTGGEGAEIAVEAAGYPDTLNNCFKYVSQHGKVVIFGIQGGLPGDMTPLNFSQFMSKTPTVIPTVGATSGDAVRHIDAMVKLKARGWWDPGEMITHRLDFSEVQKAYDMYEGVEDGVVKVVMSA
jgi:L-iditol 2-dehydrogenase